MWLAEVKKAFRRNLGLRILSLLLAIGLWLFVNAGEHESETAFQVPVEYRGLPAGLMITNPHPEFVDIRISGPHTLLSLLDPGRLAVTLDLRGIGPGQADFKIGPELFKVPRQTTIERISPAEVVLDIDQVITRQLPVKLSLSGQTADGYAVAATIVKPAGVTVSGPRRDVNSLTAIYTNPLDIGGAMTDVSRMVDLVNPGGLLRVSIDRVQGTAQIREIIAQREFHSVEIVVRDSERKITIWPHYVNCSVRGPQRQLNGFKLAGLVYIDASEIVPGIYQAPVKVDLPQGLEVVRLAPESVKMRIFRER